MDTSTFKSSKNDSSQASSPNNQHRSSPLPNSTHSLNSSSSLFSPPPPSFDEPPFSLIQWACSQTNKYFTGLLGYLSFYIVLSICAFLPFLMQYIKILGPEHDIVAVLDAIITLSIGIVIMFMSCIYLFNKTHPPSQALRIWSFTKEITWPWFWESTKALVIVISGLFLFVIPGIIKFIHYIFVSYIVFFNRSYKEGNISALKYSKELTKGMRWWILALYSSIYVLSSLLISWGQPIIFKLSSAGSVLSYLTVGGWIYITCLPSIYILSIFYFMYFAKDSDHI